MKLAILFTTATPLADPTLDNVPQPAKKNP